MAGITDEAERGLINKFRIQDNALGTLCARLYKEWKSLYTFLRFEDVEPTNNRAERALRPAVTRRDSLWLHIGTGIALDRTHPVLLADLQNAGMELF